MKELAVRLKKGDDLKESIESLCVSNRVDTAAVVSGVGCLFKARIRLAGAKDFYEKEADFEIVSLSGTVSKGKAHMHISLSDDRGNVIGGHLSKGCLVNTTCELILAVLEEYQSIRQYDEATGYDEIVFEKRGR